MHTYIRIQNTHTHTHLHNFLIHPTPTTHPRSRQSIIPFLPSNPTPLIPTSFSTNPYQRL